MALRTNAKRGFEKVTDTFDWNPLVVIWIGVAVLLLANVIWSFIH